ncbi:MAG: hypothetical protein IPK22_02490 [Verrucomicrobiaceae bacterium]|nr:hypothetical protein [Verrucomicrobiaceae bacterium]
MNISSDDNPRDWLERMVLKLREGEAMPEEVTQLRDLLATNAEARRIYLRAKQMDTLLETVPMQQMALRPSAKKEASVLRRWKFTALASAAAAVVAMAFLGFWERPLALRGRDAAVAVLNSSFEAVIDGREVLQGEQPMRAGTYKLERGSVQLRFGNGADVVIEGPAAFDLVDAATMHLNQGSLWAHCSEEARGFAVRMPGGRELVDFGTEFGARVNAEGGAEVKVMQGEVKISDAVARTLDLTTGKAATWELTAPPLAVDEAEVQPFQSALELAAKVKAAPSVENLTAVALRDLPKTGDREWNLPENWESGALPGAHKLERVVINQSRVVRVRPGLQPPPHPVDIHVSNGPAPVPGPEGTLEIQGHLECQALRIATADGADGVVNQLGGTLNVTDSLIASSHRGNPALSHYQLSGGTLNVGHVIWLGFKGPAEFTMHGSKGIVTADRMSLGPNAVLTFVLDSDGAGLIKLRDTLMRHPEAQLVIDGSQYRGGAKVIPLVVCGSDLNDGRRFTPQQVRFEGFAGLVPRLASRPGALDLVLEAVR